MRIDYGYRDCANIININYKDRDDYCSSDDVLLYEFIFGN